MGTIINPRTGKIINEYTNRRRYYELIEERRFTNQCRIERERLDLHDRGVYILLNERVRRAACGC